MTASAPGTPGQRASYEWLWRQPGRPPLVIAHRGASGAAPENTLAAFRLALDAGAPAIECDVHLSADGVPVVIHDARLDRTTSGSGDVAATTYAEVRALDAGAWFGEQFAGERVPSLDEVLALCAGRTRLIVEIKSGGGEALVDAALDVMQATSAGGAAVISFGPEEVRLVARKRPDLPLGFLVATEQVTARGPAAVFEATRALGAGFISPHHSVARHAFVDAAHAAGLPVGVWTVDDENRMRDLAGAGVDAITTNYLDRACALFTLPR